MAEVSWSGLEQCSGRTLVEGVANTDSQAAAVLLDLLDATENSSIADALTAESLAYGVLQASAEHRDWLAARKPAPVEAKGKVVVERADNLLSILLDRPQAHNAINSHLRDGLREAFELAALDPDIVRVELRAAGKAFCIGGDLAEFGTTSDPATAHLIRMQTLPAHAIARCADKLHVHVQGACIGAGLEMAAFAKRVTAAPNAWFQLPEIALGLIPGAGGCVSVPRRIGKERAAAFILSGKRIGATTALEWGLIDAIEDAS